MRKDSVGSE